ncbi:MAG TPA: hypothetical protein VF282_03695 [Bacillota bacterium]
MLDEIEAIARGDVAMEELSRAKQRHAILEALRNEEPGRWARRMGQSALYGLWGQDASGAPVTLEAIATVARDCLVHGGRAVVVHEPEMN